MVIKLLLADDGVFVVQFLYMKSIVENLAFDQIYHEHLLYYTLKTIETLLQRHGLEMFDAYLSPIHGGSIIGFISIGEQGAFRSIAGYAPSRGYFRHEQTGYLPQFCRKDRAHEEREYRLSHDGKTGR